MQRRFETPLGYRIGDCALFLLLAPLGTGAVWLLLLLPCLMVATAIAAVLGLGPETRDAALVAPLVPAAVLVPWLLRGRFGWSLTLTGDGIQLGPTWLGIRIPYDDVRFLRLGSLSERGNRSARGVPVRIRTGWLRSHVFMVAQAQADACFHELRKRCRKAPAVDVLTSPPRDHLPLDPGSRAHGVRRLQRFWAVPGVLLAIVLGSVILYVLALLVDETSRPELIDRITARPVVFIEFIVALAAGGAFARFCLRRSRMGPVAAASDAPLRARRLRAEPHTRRRARRR